MRVITKKPVIIVDNANFSNLDGSSPSADIKAFQAFAKSKGYDLGKSGVNKDGVDGVWGSKTAAAYTSIGASWEASKTPATTGTTTTTTGAPKTRAEKVKEGLTFAKESGILDTLGGLFGKKTTTEPAAEALPAVAATTETEKKGLSTGAWIGIGVGAVAVIGLIIWATKSSSSNGK